MSTVIKITEVSGTGIFVEGNDIDTDRIIPARYLKEITFTNMGNYAFYDERFDPNGNPKQHSFNDPKYKGASILVVNKNFGCGSSREHAPQALMRYGIKAVIGESFAEIFAGNCTVLGIPTATISETHAAELVAAIRQNPKTPIRLNLSEQKLDYAGKQMPISAADFIRRALTEGTWDSTRLMLANMDKVHETARRLPYVKNFS